MLVGAGRVAQLAENIACLDVELTQAQLARLDAAGALPQFNPYFIFALPVERIFGGQSVQPWR